MDKGMCQFCYLIIINGSPSLSPSLKGPIRQGDPLALFLFYWPITLSRMIEATGDGNPIHRFTCMANDPKVTCFLFANDTRVGVLGLCRSG